MPPQGKITGLWPWAKTSEQREERLGAEALSATRVSELDTEFLISLARSAPPRTLDSSFKDIPDAEKALKLHEQLERREEVIEQFRNTFFKRIVEAYQKGVESATDKESRRAYNTRSIVLLLVVLAVVLMPIIAMLIGLSPQSFGAYIAPVTGIAGTVVGYWFGTANHHPGPRE